MCFYVDTAYAIVLWLIIRYCTQGMEEAAYKPVLMSILGIFGHGVGHLFIAVREERDVTLTPYEMYNKSTFELVKSYSIYFFFWFTLTLSFQEELGKLPQFSFAVAFLTFQYFLVPETIAFSYVQAMLILCACFVNAS